MATPTDLRLDGLNFDAIKENFKSFLQNQDQFRDYNFESSGISVLLDVLAYNTYYNSFYLNMVSTESFLATAQRRNSVVNLARSMNYVPRSTSSARIVGNMTLTTAGSAASIVVPKYTKFEATVNDVSYYFLTQEALTFVLQDGAYVRNNITLIEGKKTTDKYTKDINDVNQRFLITNSLADTSTLSVRVINSSSDSYTRVFNRVDNLVNIDGNSLVYFLEEVEDGKFEVFFGDDTTGKALVNGNLIYLEYLVSAGSAANDVQNISYYSSVEDVSGITFTTTTSSYGGDERESIDRIRFNAPKSYAAQNRAITAEDYASIVLSQPNIGSVTVWGGEDNDPPYYGKVFIAVKPKVGETLTETEKQNLINFVIEPKKILTITPEIVDPEYTYLTLDITAKYDGTQNTLSTTSLTSVILSTVMNYVSNDLGEFSRYFRFSKLSRLIDTSERSILSSNLVVKMKKEVFIQLGVNARYEIDFSNAIDNVTESRPSTHPYNAGNKLSSNEFTYNGYPNCFLEDNGGLIRVYRKSGSSYVGVSANVGTINYATGKVILTDFAVDSFLDDGTTLNLLAVPQNYDILPLRTQIITVREEDVNVTLVDDNTISLTKR